MCGHAAEAEAAKKHSTQFREISNHLRGFFAFKNNATLREVIARAGRCLKKDSFYMKIVCIYCFFQFRVICPFFLLACHSIKLCAHTHMHEHAHANTHTHTHTHTHCKIGILQLTTEPDHLQFFPANICLSFASFVYE